MRLTFVLLSSMALATNLTAQTAQFRVDPARSSVAMSGTFAGNTIQQQGAGSLQTTYQGIIRANVSASTIQFTGGSMVDANISGDWQPLANGATGSAPADYGAQVSSFTTVRAALRNVVLDVTSETLPVAGGSFNPGTLVFSFPETSTASLDYNAGFLGSGSERLASASTNQAATTASIIGESGNRTLTLNIDTTFEFDLFGGATIRFAGQIVAVEEASAPTPQFSDVRYVNGELVMRVEGASDAAQLQSATDLRTWSPKSAQVTTDGAARIYRVPATAPREFFRIAQ